MGPASDSPRVIERLLRAGMDVARLNFSHGSYEEHRQRLEKLRRASRKLDLPLAVIQDLAGPKIRTGDLPEGGIEKKPGDTVMLSGKKLPPGPDVIPVSYPRLAREVKEGDAVLLADGAIELKVSRVEADLVRCRVIVGGVIGSRKGVNIASQALSIEGLTKKDRQDLAFAIKEDVDFVALSFVRSAAEVKRLADVLKKRGREKPVIAKIEKPQALDNIQEIMDHAQAIMVARGDLGVEIPLEDVPAVQKSLISEANLAGKPVITATHMLRSMVSSKRPTRAEVTDVANAVWDGSDAVMLSEETAIGSYPVDAVKVMDRIARSVESHMAKKHARPQPYPSRDPVPDSISYSASLMAEDLGARAIIAPTRSGATARRISRYRPASPVIALTPDKRTVRELCLAWGVAPVFMPEIKSGEDLTKKALEWARRTLKLKKGDRIIITSGAACQTGTTNTIHLEEI